jgi:hypothetical protein
MNKIHKIIAGAIHSAFIDYPMKNDGTRWDAQYKGAEESELLANAVLIALSKNGFQLHQTGKKRTEAPPPAMAYVED